MDKKIAWERGNMVDSKLKVLADFFDMKIKYRSGETISKRIPVVRGYKTGYTKDGLIIVYNNTKYTVIRLNDEKLTMSESYPVPDLTGIYIEALIGIDLSKRGIKGDKQVKVIIAYGRRISSIPTIVNTKEEMDIDDLMLIKQ